MTNLKSKVCGRGHVGSFYADGNCKVCAKMRRDARKEGKTLEPVPSEMSEDYLATFREYYMESTLAVNELLKRSWV